MSIFSERLQERRRKQGFSSQTMADLLHITVRAYQFYEQGKREPTYTNLVTLAKHLDVSTDYLLGLKDEPK